MRKIKEVFRLGLVCGLSLRAISRSCHVSHPTVHKYLAAAQTTGLTWPQIESLTDWQLLKIVKQTQSKLSTLQKPMPDYAHIHQELRKDGVTLDLLWHEYKETQPDGYQFTQFTKYYRQFKRTLNLSLRQTYKAGEKMFVDFAGTTVPVYDRSDDQVRSAQIFVATLGASNYTFACAVWDQKLPSWIGCHQAAFEYFGGVTQVIVSDNLKAGVTSPCRYEPDINPAYYDMAAHYSTVVIPARIKKPKDKAKVECAVLVVERWILAALRKQKFFSLEELNQAIKDLLVKLNQRPFKKLTGSRESLFKQIDQPALKPLPELPYELACWKKARVNIDYHVELDGHYYSVPYSLIHQQLDLRYNEHTVEIFHNGSRIAAHKRDTARGRHTTVKEHMPKIHQQFLGWTPSRILECAGQIGEHTKDLAERIMTKRQYPELGYRTCLGIIRLAKQYSQVRLEAACGRALSIGACSYRSVRSILEKGLDRRPATANPAIPALTHENIRGSGYFTNQ